MWELNPVKMTDEDLDTRRKELQEIVDSGYRTEARLLPIRREIGHIVFEQMQRYKEKHPEDTSELETV